MRAPAPPTLDYECHCPHGAVDLLERRGLRLCTTGRWRLASAAIAISVSATSIGIMILAALVSAEAPFINDDGDLLLLFTCTITLPVIVALITYPVGVILQTFGEAYLERADVRAHLDKRSTAAWSPPGDHTSPYPILSLPRI